MLFAAVAAAATVLTLTMPLVYVDPLDKRMRAVALEREKIRQRERERMAQENQKVKLRQSPKQYVQGIVDQFNLSKWVGQEEARLKLIQAGYRGQAPYVTYLFIRMMTPVLCFLFSLIYLFVVLKFDQPAMVSVLPRPMSACNCRSCCSRTRSRDVSCRSNGLSPTRSTCS
jgi:tight adherence protein C